MTIKALYSSGNALYYLGQMVVTGNQSMGSFRFLRDHVVNGVYIQAGTIREMFIEDNWTVTADVEPIDQTATDSFYDQGPQLGGVLNQQWVSPFAPIIPKPITYWYEIAPFVWALSGLGKDQVAYPPKFLRLGRVE